MNQVTFEKIGGLVKISVTGKSERYRSAVNTEVSLIKEEETLVAIQVGNIIENITSFNQLFFNGVAVTDQDDFDTKLATVFPDEGGGSSTPECLIYTCQIFQGNTNPPYDNVQGDHTLGDGFIQYTYIAPGIYSGYIPGDAPLANQNLTKFIYSCYTIDDKIVKITYVDQNNISIVQTDLAGQTIDGITRLDLKIEVYDSNSYND